VRGLRPEATPTLYTADDRVILRPAATPEDAELLRRWKNAHRFAFFDQREIDVARQMAWFAALTRRDDDFMFVVVIEGVDAGSIGVRLQDGAAEVYNVNLGREELGGAGYMSAALQRLISFAKTTYALPVVVEVLKDNPAVRWYERNGFEVVQDRGGSWDMVWRGRGHEADTDRAGKSGREDEG
jgi:RimJ/RimL family protein N-acetyltransferase